MAKCAQQIERVAEIRNLTPISSLIVMGVEDNDLYFAQGTLLGKYIRSDRHFKISCKLLPGNGE